MSQLAVTLVFVILVSSPIIHGGPGASADNLYIRNNSRSLIGTGYGYGYGTGHVSPYNRGYGTVGVSEDTYQSGYGIQSDSGEYVPYSPYDRMGAGVYGRIPPYASYGGYQQSYGVYPPGRHYGRMQGMYPSYGRGGGISDMTYMPEYGRIGAGYNQPHTGYGTYGGYGGSVGSGGYGGLSGGYSGYGGYGGRTNFRNGGYGGQAGYEQYGAYGGYGRYPGLSGRPYGGFGRWPPENDRTTFGLPVGVDEYGRPPRRYPVPPMAMSMASQGSPGYYARHHYNNHYYDHD